MHKALWPWLWLWQKNKIQIQSFTHMYSQKEMGSSSFIFFCGFLMKTFASNEVLSSMYNIYLSFFLKLFFLLSTFYQHHCLNLREESQRWECTLYRAQNQLLLFFFKTFSDPTLFHKFKISKKVSDHNNKNTCIFF